MGGVPRDERHQPKYDGDAAFVRPVPVGGAGFIARMLLFVPTRE